MLLCQHDDTQRTHTDCHASPQFHACLLKALTASSFSLPASHALALFDWQRMTHACGHGDAMDFLAFANAVFEIVDVWNVT